MGYRFSPSLMSALHTIYISGANCTFHNIDLGDVEARNENVLKTPTTTYPYLETNEGNISETNAIQYYIAEKYKKDLLGNNIFEKAKINQWMEFAACELNRCQKSLIYPIFGWKDFNKESAENENTKLKEYLKILEKKLENKNYIVGNRLTLADIALFRYLRFFMLFQFPDGMRKKLIPNVTKWFEKIMNTNEAVKAYGRTMLCKIPAKPFMGTICRTKQNEIIINKSKEKKVAKIDNNDKKVEKTGNTEEVREQKKEKKPKSSLPRTKLNLEEFKISFLNNKNKEEAIERFWEEYDLEDYSLWWIEYQNSPEEGKILSKASNAKSDFLRKLDNFRKNCFAVHGVYGREGNYIIRGAWIWRGKDIPKEIEGNDYYDRLNIRNLDPNNKDDVELVSDYWTKLKPTDKVQGRFAADCSYFN